MTERAYRLGPYFCNDNHHALLHRILEHHCGPNEGLALEFGVGGGASLHCISRYMPTVGFDSFEGLPEDWREGYPKGMFASDPPVTNARESLVVGLFEDTVPKWFADWESDKHAIASGTMWVPKAINFIHIDCDLYSATKTVLDNLPWKWLTRWRTLICFDEWHGYPGCEEHEQRAWREAVVKHDLDWEVLGHGHQQWGIRLV